MRERERQRKGWGRNFYYRLMLPRHPCIFSEDMRCWPGHNPAQLCWTGRASSCGTGERLACGSQPTGNLDQFEDHHSKVVLRHCPWCLRIQLWMVCIRGSGNLWTRHISTIWELIRNVNSRSPPKIHWIRNPRRRPTICFNKPSEWLGCMFDFNNWHEGLKGTSYVKIGEE